MKTRTALAALICIAVVFTFGLFAVPAYAETSRDHGLTEGGLLRGVGLLAAVGGLIGLVLVEFVYRRRLSTSAYRWLLLIFLLLIPPLAALGAMATMLEETKTVQSCASCHIMLPFVNDLKDPKSSSLAARHFRNGWIPKNQCYACHTTYGVHGTMASKRDGFRHWLLYVTKTWKEPISFKGSYPNSNCLGCHESTPKFRRVQSHAPLAAYLASDKVSCVSCHGPPHPTDADRSLRKAYGTL